MPAPEVDNCDLDSEPESGTIRASFAIRYGWNAQRPRSIVEGMKYLSYLGETVLTTDGVSDAVIEYARALVDDRSADVVHIPVVQDDAETTATLLLGPASQLIVIEASATEMKLQDEPVIERMRARIAALGPHRARPADTAIADDEAISFDFL